MFMWVKSIIILYYTYRGISYTMQYFNLCTTQLCGRTYINKNNIGIHIFKYNYVGLHLYLYRYRHQFCVMCNNKIFLFL